MRFDYYYGSQADQFSFIRIPPRDDQGSGLRRTVCLLGFKIDLP